MKYKFKYAFTWALLLLAASSQVAFHYIVFPALKSGINDLFSTRVFIVTSYKHLDNWFKGRMSVKMVLTTKPLLPNT